MDGAKLVKVALVLAAIGLADAAYLTIDHYTNIPVACPSVGIINCGDVLNSSYSSLFGVPFAVLGLVFFAIEIAVILLGNKDLLVLYNGVGIAVVAYLVYTEYLIGHICLFCTLVHVLVVTLFALSVVYYDSWPVKKKSAGAAHGKRRGR